MSKDELKGLQPEERLKRLKLLEEEKKKEIEEAHKLLIETEKELTDKRKWVEKVPIPQVAQESLEGLSIEGKEVLKAHKGIKEKKREEETETPKSKKEEPERKQSLEEALLQETAPFPQKGLGNVEYGIPGTPGAVAGGMEYKPLGALPTTELYQEMSSLKRSIDEKGYISREDTRKAEYITGVIEDRREGGYEFTRDVGKLASLTQEIGSSIRQEYQSRGREKVVGHDWYSGK